MEMVLSFSRIFFSSSFNELGLAYEQEVEVNKTTIGGATCRLLDFRSVIDFATEYLK